MPSARSAAYVGPITTLDYRPILFHISASAPLGYLGARPRARARARSGVGNQDRTHSFPRGIPTPIRPLSVPASAPQVPVPFFVCGLSGPLGLSSASFRPALRLRSRAIHARFCSSHAPPGVRPKYSSSPLSHPVRATPAGRPVGCRVLSLVLIDLLLIGLGVCWPGPDAKF